MTIRIVRNWVKILSTVILLVLSGGMVLADGQPKAVMELFTSQGCSSCPAADKVLAQYAQDNKILALAYHVDYWNYLGWKDTFSKPEFSDRQRRYAASFNRRGVYTPQAVINGRDHVVGSSAQDIQSLMRSFQSAGKGLTVPVSARRTGDELRIVADRGTGDATLWIVYFDNTRTVAIKRGENRGKTIPYHNIVREISMLGMMKNGKLEITLPLDEMRHKGHDSCALILQQKTASGTPGPIIGATVIDGMDG